VRLDLNVHYRRGSSLLTSWKQSGKLDDVRQNCAGSLGTDVLVGWTMVSAELNVSYKRGCKNCRHWLQNLMYPTFYVGSPTLKPRAFEKDDCLTKMKPWTPGPMGDQQEITVSIVLNKFCRHWDATELSDPQSKLVTIQLYTNSRDTQQQ